MTRELSKHTLKHIDLALNFCLFLVLGLIKYFSSQIATDNDECLISFDFTEI